ncbi:MAG: alpha/beta hydrolase fold domain-containing protein [Opitutales bacterium]
MKTLPLFIQKVTAWIFLCMSPFYAAIVNGQNPKDEVFVSLLRIEKNIIYKTVEGEKLDLWLFLPQEAQPKPMPVMLYTHGGGWGGGDKFKVLQPAFRQTLKRLLNAGVACAAIEYRLTRKGVSTAIDSVGDCKDAARFLMANAATYNLDPERMGVWGGSAGGHLALMTGLADNAAFEGDASLAKYSPEFRCIASYYPATTFLNPELLKGSNFERPQRMIPMIGGLAADYPERAVLLSPSEHLRADSPPILLLHGDQDSILPITLSDYFAEHAKNLGANLEYIVVKGGEHSFRGNISPSMSEINEHAANFILSHLRADN